MTLFYCSVDYSPSPATCYLTQKAITLLVYKWVHINNYPTPAYKIWGSNICFDILRGRNIFRYPPRVHGEKWTQSDPWQRQHKSCTEFVEWVQLYCDVIEMCLNVLAL